MNAQKIVAVARPILVALFAVFVMLSCEAAVRTWCGPSGEQDWSAATNWVDEAVATGSDTAYFPHNAAYHPNGTGRRRYWFKVAPPDGFTGTILTTNEMWSLDGQSSSHLNKSFRTKLELGVADGAIWTVAGDGCVVATEGVAARISGDFAGTIEVRAGDSFSVPAAINGKVRFVGAGTLALSSGAQFNQAEAFAGSIILPPSESVRDATLTPLQNSSLQLGDGQTLAFDADALAYSQITKMESFAEAPGKWSFNGTAWADGNLPSGPFNKSPPYVLDGELWLTDEPAQIHTAWYTNRTFRLTDDWGMSFTYWPELPSDTRITTEERADGKTRGHCICGYFGILFSRTSPTNVGRRASDGTVSLADDARGFLIDLYRDDPQAKVMWLAESNYNNYRSVLENELGGIKLNAKMEVAVSMVRGEMTVTLKQDGKSATFSHDFTAMGTRAAEGCYIGLGGSSSWWGDEYAVPWVRNRVSNFRAWYRDETDGAGWAAIDNSSEFDIGDPSKWDYRKVTRTSATAETTNNASLFVADGVRLTDAATSNCAFIISKANPPKRSVPMCFSYRFKTADPAWTATEYGQITFLFGSNSSSTRSNGASWSSPAYGNTFGAWTGGIDWIWNANNGEVSLNEAYHSSGTRRSVAASDSFGSMGSTYAAAMASPEKDLRADIVWNPNGTFKTFVSVAAQDHTGEGRCGYCTYTGLAEKNNYANFTNRTDWTVGVKAVCRNKAYAAITLTDLSIRRLAAAVGGEAGTLSVPAGAAASIKAGEAMDGQTSPVLSVASLDLGAGATLTVRPESSQTRVNVASVGSSGAMLAAANGATVLLGDTLTIDATPDSAGLTLAGNVVCGESISLVVPDTWRRYRNGPIVAIDASGITDSFDVDPANVTVATESGAIPASKYSVSVSQKKLLLTFGKGFSFIVR